MSEVSNSGSPVTEYAIHVIPELENKMNLPFPHHHITQCFLTIDAFSLASHHHLYDRPAIPEFSHVQRTPQVALAKKISPQKTHTLPIIRARLEKGTARNHSQGCVGSTCREIMMRNSEINVLCSSAFTSVTCTIAK